MIYDNIYDIVRILITFIFIYDVQGIFLLQMKDVQICKCANVQMVFDNTMKDVQICKCANVQIVLTMG